MTSDLERISAIWREQSGSYYEQLADAILARGGPSYATIARDQLLVSCQLVVTAWQTALDTNESTSIREFGTLIGRRRSEGHIAIDDIMRVVDILREGVLQALTRAYPGSEWNSAIATRCEGWLHELRNSIVSSYGVTLQAAEEGLAEREQAMAAQRRLIQELSTPIVPIHEGVLVLPIIGTIDSRRATQILEAALERIVAAQAEILILDITGVPYIDTNVANYLLQMVRAVTLLGAQSVLVGIGTEIAQTLVHLGVDLSGVIVRANLQAGIVYALHHMGLAIQPLNSRD
jgi:rsbT co-antagonist protein RsbR